MAKCAKVKQDGERCTADVSDEGSFCLFHDPARRAEAQAARRKGAKATNSKKKGRIRTVHPGEAPPPPQTLEDAISWASWGLHAVATGKIDGRTAHEIGYLCRAFMDGRRTADKLDDRVKELSAKVAQLRDAS